MKIKIYATLRPIVGDPYVLDVIEPGQDVRALVDGMVTRWPDLRAEMLDENNNLLDRIHIFINGRRISYLEGLDTIVSEGDDIAIFPPVGGG
jgi:molybdopterin synthase sulfur carrier subunit